MRCSCEMAGGAGGAEMQSRLDPPMMVDDKRIRPRDRPSFPHTGIVPNACMTGTNHAWPASLKSCMIYFCGEQIGNRVCFGFLRLPSSG